MDMLPMAAIDFIFVIILSICALRGYLRGAHREIIPLITWLVAIIISIYFSEQFANIYLNSFFKPGAANVVAEIILTIIILLVGLVCSYGLKVLLICYEVNTLNRVLGVVLSLARGMVISMLIIHSVNRTDLSQHSAWKDSIIVQQLAPILSHIDRDIHDRNTFHYSPTIKSEDPELMD